MTQNGLETVCTNFRIAVHGFFADQKPVPNKYPSTMCALDVKNPGVKNAENYCTHYFTSTITLIKYE